MIFFLSILVFIALLFDFYTKQEKFGEHPKGERLKRIKKAGNYKNNQFQNISPTPVMAEGVSYFTVLKEFLFDKHPNTKPKTTLPSQKINLKELNLNENILVWFGHSGYFMKVDGRKFLIDPVLSGSASPLAFTTRSFAGSDVYTADDLPEIDYLIITHDHWDHMDHKTILKLKPRIKKIITSLGVGEHLERWGFLPSAFIETNWGDHTELESGFVIHTCSARHFSGRTFKRAKTVWSSFALKTPSMNLFLGGDSGYDDHFKSIGKQFGPFDIAILECGQYHSNWKHIHLMPEETVQAAIDLNSKHLMPVHWGKFTLAMHSWDDPIKRVAQEAKIKKMALVSPHIGEKVNLENLDKPFKEWWLEVN